MFERWDADGFSRHYRQQIRRAVQDRHDVQLHLHPHWIDTEYRDGAFIPASSFQLGNFQDRNWPNNIPGIVSRGCEFLTELCRGVDPGYHCVAYRAGGYNLAPGTASILSSLYDNGIRIDSSIAKGFRFRSGISEVDYRAMPARANWFIARTGPLDREALSGLYEIPIAASPRTPANNLSFLLKRVLYRGRTYRSGGWGIQDAHTTRLQKVWRLFPCSAWMLGFDNHTESVRDLMKTLKYYIKNHSQAYDIICSAISHPKSMGEYSRSLMRGFVERVRREYGDRAEFCTYRQIYDELGLGERSAGDGQPARPGAARMQDGRGL